MSDLLRMTRDVLTGQYSVDQPTIKVVKLMFPGFFNEEHDVVFDLSVDEACAVVDLLSRLQVQFPSLSGMEKPVLSPKGQLRAMQTSQSATEKSVSEQLDGLTKPELKFCIETILAAGNVPKSVMQKIIDLAKAMGLES